LYAAWTFLLSELLGQEFLRDVPVQLEVFGFVNHTHPAATEFLQDAIVRSFGWRCCAPPHFVEEVFEEDYVALGLLRFRCLDWH
jgi:hypothetical protein